MSTSYVRQYLHGLPPTKDTPLFVPAERDSLIGTVHLKRLPRCSTRRSTASENYSGNCPSAILGLPRYSPDVLAGLPTTHSSFAFPDLPGPARPVGKASCVNNSTRDTGPAISSPTRQPGLTIKRTHSGNLPSQQHLESEHSHTVTDRRTGHRPPGS